MPTRLHFDKIISACAVSKLKMADFFTDPATLVGLGAVAAAAVYYVATRPAAAKPPYPLDNQSVELLVIGTQISQLCLITSGVNTDRVVMVKGSHIWLRMGS